MEANGPDTVGNCCVLNRRTARTQEKVICLNPPAKGMGKV